MKERRPAAIFPPGEFIREELEARGWTQDDLADILSRPLQTVNEVITGKRGITPETAKGLGEAFGTSAQYWMNLESVYRLSLENDNGKAVTRRAAIYDMAPVRAMIKRGWIKQTGDIDVLEQQLLDFFGIKSIRETPKFLCATRKSTAYTDMTPGQRAWLFRAGLLAGNVAARPYTVTGLDACLAQLKPLLARAEDIIKIPGLLSSFGIKLLIIEPLPQSKIDGACFWEGDTPVVTLSLRYDRIDWFWYTLMHEIGHIRNVDAKKSRECVLDTDMMADFQTGDGRPAYEIAADRFATSFLVPQDQFGDFIARVKPRYSKKRIESFAGMIGVNAGIIVGQLQHRKEIKYSQYREFLVKVRHIITTRAPTDGWGLSFPSKN